MISRAVFLLLCACLGIGLSGCNRSDPHAMTVEAKSPSALARWRMKATDRFTRDEWRELDAAVQDVRLRVMAEREASGSDAVEQAMCGRIDGLTFRGVLVLGYESKLKRLDPVRAELKRALDGNALLVTKSGDRASEAHLAGLRARQRERLIKLDAEIEAAEQRLVQLGDKAVATEMEKRKRERAREPESPTLSREEARAQFTEMLDGQRSAALLKFGAWPARIERTDVKLPEPERAEFMERHATAAARGHVVIAIRLQGRWWIYDAPAEPPAFSSAVAANLTEEDRREMNESWWTLQAELWARRQAEQAKEQERLAQP